MPDPSLERLSEALKALRDAYALSKAADVHVRSLVALCGSLGASPYELQEILELRDDEPSQ